MLIVVLFGFLNITSVKTYAISYIFSSTLLLYKLDTLLLKQKNLPVLDITGFFFRIRTLMISNTGRFFCSNNTVSYACRCSVPEGQVTFEKRVNYFCIKSVMRRNKTLKPVIKGQLFITGEFLSPNSWSLNKGYIIVGLLLQSMYNNT